MSTPPICARCGQPMRRNVPRLGVAGGFVHAATSRLECTLPEPEREQPHPIEKHLADRFDWLTEDQRALMLRCVKGTPRSHWQEELVELISDLAIHVHAEHERQLGAGPYQMTDEDKAAMDAFFAAQMGLTVIAPKPEPERQRERDPCTCARSGYEGFPCPVHSP